METSGIIVLIVVAVVAFIVWKEQGKESKGSKPTKSASVSADRNNNGVVSQSELGKLTKNQLFDLAEKKSLKVKKSGSKAVVIKEIWTQLKEADDSDEDEGDEL